MLRTASRSISYRHLFLFAFFTFWLEPKRKKKFKAAPEFEFLSSLKLSSAG